VFFPYKKNFFFPTEKIFIFRLRVGQRKIGTLVEKFLLGFA